ncbi:TPA: hypothetical protein QCI11_001442 [Enterobacter ludwigii]|uniref:hypothetical protein n=1 Tax=Siccibacter colletis TaxID=1505757 RepID=UPI0028BF48A3|nr:hypothetical protein [Siccibacter colletis]WNN48066.1 hypothetical protein RIN58_17105 [Siccibacter colletis]HDR2536154.1 hypothetical protein [Enterobacter ludwigii]
MVSKKRITVNLSYPELHQMIVSLAKRTGSSSSAVIQDMILDALKYRMENDALLPSGKLVANKNLVPERVFNAGFEINNLTIDGMVRGTTDAFHRLFQRDSFIETLPYIMFSDVPKPAEAINKNDILRRVIAYLQTKLYVPDNSEFKPALFLFFIGKVTVKYRQHTADGLEVKIDFSCKVIPVHTNRSNGDEALLFDLNNIKYRPFHDIAKKGWNRKKHSHQLYINGLEGMRGGGFFVGVLYEPQSPDELVTPSEGDFISSTGLRYRFFRHPSAVKIIKNHFPKSVTIDPNGTTYTVKEKTIQDVDTLNRAFRKQNAGW